MSMEYSRKVEVVEELAGRFKQAPITILADFKGLTVAQMTDLRRQVGEADGEFVVAKNTLARLAVKDTDNSVIDPMLAGPTGFAFGYGDPVSVAKAIEGFAKKAEALDIKGAVFEGELLESAQVVALASLPGRDELRAQLLALLMTPATQLVRVLAAPAQQVVRVLEARRNDLGEEAE